MWLVAGEALPRLYGILDAETLERLGLQVVDTALQLSEAGVRMLQYRDKGGTRESVLGQALAIAAALEGRGAG